MDLPHINVLTKIDNLVNHPPLLFNLDYYTEVQDLEYLLPHLDRERQGLPPPDPDADDDPIDEQEEAQPPSRFAALNEAIVDLVQDFSLVGFETLAVEDKTSMSNLLKAIDRASGYVFGAAEGANATIWQVAMREGVTMDVKDVQERWIDDREKWDKIRRQEWEEEGRAWRGDEGEQGPITGNSDQQPQQDDEDDGALDDLMRLRGITNTSGGSGVNVRRAKPAEGNG